MLEERVQGQCMCVPRSQSDVHKHQVEVELFAYYHAVKNKVSDAVCA